MFTVELVDQSTEKAFRELSLGPGYFGPSCNMGGSGDWNRV